MIYEFLGSLPAPWGGLAKVLLILTGISLACALILWQYLSFLRLLGWLRDALIFEERPAQLRDVPA